MKSISVLVAATAGVALLAGCASTPPRPAYEGADTVGAVDKAALVGTWEVRQLNPVPDTEYPKIITTLNEDGTVTSNIIPQGEMAQALGSTTYDSTGNWGTEGDWLLHSDVQMKTRDNSDSNQFSALMDKIINNAMKDKDSRANVYEVSADRFVVVSPDGAALEYVRVK